VAEKTGAQSLLRTGRKSCNRVLSNRVLGKTSNTRFCQNPLSWLYGNLILLIHVLVTAPKQDISLLGRYLSLRKIRSAKTLYPNRA
jgi:hypothetical protein